MSGGSLGYLYNREPHELFEATQVQHMEEAAAEAYNAGYKDIAMDIYRLVEYVNSANIRVAVLAEQLEEVFHAIEWRLSADYGDDDLRKALEAYRAGKGGQRNGV